MSEHHSESPSHYNAWQHCVGWRSVEKDTAESSAGSHHHKEMEKGLLDYDYEPDTYVSRYGVQWVRENAGDAIVMTESKLTGTLPGVEGIFGFVDAMWLDYMGTINIADLKSFSDGTENYLPQLKGYVALWATDTVDPNRKVMLHVIHGGVCRVESVETTVGECYRETERLLKRVREDDGERNICKYCQYCANIKECPMANNAVQVVNGNGAVDFSKMSLPQKLVICETVEKLIKSLKDEAKQKAIDNGGVLEDGEIRYEIKERAGKGRVRDLCEVAGAVAIPSVMNKDGVNTQLNGLTPNEILSMCELSKTAFINAMKEKNADIKSVPKKNIEAWCASFFDKGEPTQYLARVK